MNVSPIKGYDGKEDTIFHLDLSSEEDLGYLTVPEIINLPEAMPKHVKNIKAYKQMLEAESSIQEMRVRISMAKTNGNKSITNEKTKMP